jgi:hypothetical protein
MKALPSGRIAASLLIVALLLQASLPPLSAADSNGRFEWYCDGLGFFLAGINGASEPKEFALFLGLDFPRRPLPTEEWQDVSIFPKGCVLDGRCKSIGNGKVWLEKRSWLEAENMLAKRIYGKYKLDVNGKHLEGTFTARMRTRPSAYRVCQ